ncbi:MAG: dephospho-CoA kinase [Pyrinomonadaceae bacterium]|nr:dephospho-CoA kinase [Pyrinomonadaceae bacterium]
MLTVGLTGSIAVGKSFVCSVLREAGVRVLDADLTARAVVAKGTEGLAEVVRHFGDGILTPGGELDRKALGAIVFADEEKRLLLNSLIHPRVFEAQDAWLREAAAADPGGIAVIDAALMIESGGYKRFNKIIVVWCEPVIQLERLMLRDKLSRQDAEKRIAAQMPQEEKKRFADHLIETSCGFDDTRRQTLELVELLRQQASESDDC